MTPLWWILAAGNPMAAAIQGHPLALEKADFHIQEMKVVGVDANGGAVIIGRFVAAIQDQILKRDELARDGRIKVIGAACVQLPRILVPVAVKPFDNRMIAAGP